jgi:hypothetical protein
MELALNVPPLVVREIEQMPTDCGVIEIASGVVDVAPHDMDPSVAAATQTALLLAESVTSPPLPPSGSDGVKYKS